MTIRVLITRRRPAPMLKLAKYLLILVLASVTTLAAAAPYGYSINSDSPNDTHFDNLYRIDLSSGAVDRIGPVTSNGILRTDIEGLAFAPDGTLYGIDDDYLRLFPLNTDNGRVQTSGEVAISGLPFGGKNDFGMTFTCDGTLYVTSVTNGSLYSMDLEGNATPVGSLGANISALAAYGEDPTVLYGLGNGLDTNMNPVEATLYSIDINSGLATPIGALGQVGTYAEGGLSFDDSGQLWAITDRRDGQGTPQPSQVMKVDVSTGAASAVQNTPEAGFESLAITVPRGCDNGSGSNAQFKVQKQFLDGNQDLPTTLNIRCDGGLPLEQSFTTQPGAGVEVTFTVTDFIDGELNCDVWETTSDDYYATFECFSTGECTTAEDKCSFTNTSIGQDNLCAIRNYPETVEVTVASEWIDNRENVMFSGDAVTIDLICRNVLGGDGEWQPGGMRWTWNYLPGDPPSVAIVEPGFGGNSECRTETTAQSSAVESTSNCDSWTSVTPGGEPLTCTVVHTAFFEGIPTLSRGGLILASLLLMVTGLVFVRRF